MKGFVYTIIAIVGIAVIAGFFIVGSPQEGRLRRFDERRIQDLSFLQGEIVNYWQNKQQLPPNLGVLRDDLRGITVSSDPADGSSYGYAVKGEVVFELCANFSRPSENLQGSRLEPTVPTLQRPFGLIASSWEHEAGRQCFERTIDPDFFPQTKPGD